MRNTICLKTILVVMTIGAFSMRSSLAAAQQPQQTTNVASPATPFPRTPEDTGWTVPHTFIRYATPAECAASVRWNENEYWSNKRWDTVYHVASGDSLRNASKAVVAACADKFTAGNTAQRELVG